MKQTKKMVVVGFLAALALSSALQAAMAIRVVDAYRVDNVRFTATAGEPMYVAIEGDGDTDLDLCVKTRSGVILECDLNWSDSAEVFFVAPYTGTYYASIENLGSVYNEYVIWVE